MIKNQLKNKKMSKKLFVSIAIIFAAATNCLHSQTYDTYLYESDFRIGVTVGANMNLQRSVLIWPDINCKLTEVKESFKEKINPMYGIYLGYEKQLQNNRLRLGVDGNICYHTDTWTVDFINDTNDGITTIKHQTTTISIDEGMYLAFLINDQLAVNAGLSIYESLLFPEITFFSSVDKNGQSVDSPLLDEILDPKTGKPKEIFKFGVKVGASLRVGATYHFNDLIFLSGNIHYSVPFYNTIGKDNYTFEGDLYAENNLGLICSRKSFIQNLSLLVTFGFKL